MATTLPYSNFKQHLIAAFGEALHRVPVDAGFGCPNRGADGTGGCAFCAEDGGRAHQTRGAASLEDQIRAGVEFAQRRYGARRFLAYVQAFTGTFASVEAQRAVYDRILAAHPFDALSIGTRPDCLPEPTLALLEELGRRLPVWVELGVQTVHDATLRRVNRGHDWDCSRRAILALHGRGLRVAAHVILGLPGETAEHFRATAAALAALPLAAIKIHNLHVIRGTALARDYAERPFPVMDEREYAPVVIDFLRRLPPALPIMRLCTDTPARELVAPRWALSKTQFLALVEREMKRNGWQQGDLARG